MSPLTRRQFIGATAGLAVVANSLAAPAQSLTINPRSSWGAELPPKGELSSEDVRFLIVHHSASHNGHGAADVPGILRSWFDFHTGPEKGWPDIAYNFIIDSSGGIWEGRQGSIEGPVAGSATGGNQGFTQLVCVIGDTNQTPATPAAHASLVHVLAWLAERYGISTAPGAQVTFTSKGSNRWAAGTEVTTPTIAGHRDMSQTTCPGDSLYSYVTGSLSADVDAVRGGSTSLTTQPSPTTSSTPATVTTTVPPSTTTIPPSTTTVPPSSTTTVAQLTTTTTATTSTTPTSPTTTLPVAAPPVSSGPSAPTGLIATAGTLLLAGVGLVFWRYRRMGGPGHKPTGR